MLNQNIDTRLLSILRHTGYSAVTEISAINFCNFFKEFINLILNNFHQSQEKFISLFINEDDFVCLLVCLIIGLLFFFRQ